MQTVFLHLVNMSITAGWLVLAVLVLRLIFRRAPRWIPCMLWGLVGLRLIVPISIESVLSLIPSPETISPEIVRMPAPEISSGVPVIDAGINPVLSSTMAIQVDSGISPMERLLDVTCIIWLAGIALLLLYTVFSYVHLRRRVRTAVLLRDNIWQSEYVSSPFILGIFRPRIYLPFHLSEQEMASVLAHERAHLKRLDHLVKPLAFLLLSVYWFHPLLWLAYFLLCRDIELACDERAVRDMAPRDRADYSATLLTCSLNRRSFAACPLAFGEVGVPRRIKAVLHYKKPSFWIILAAVAACVVVAVCFLTNPAGESEAAPQLPESRYYEVDAVLYTDPRFDSFPDPATAPTYHITDSGQLRLRRQDSGQWLTVGNFAAESLSSKTFDSGFPETHTVSGWADASLSAAQLRQENDLAWRVDAGVDETFFLLLQQRSGTICLVCGYEPDGNAASENDALIRWIVRLKESSGSPQQSSPQQTPAANDAPVIDTTAAVPFGPEDIHNLAAAQATFPFGDFLVEDPETLQSLQALLSAGEILPSGGAGCPFSSPLYLLRSDGVVGLIYPAEDSCGVFRSDAGYFRYAASNDTLYALLGVQPYFEQETYNEQGQLIRLTTYNWYVPGETTTYTYDDTGRLASETWTSADSSITRLTEYTYDEAGFLVREHTCDQGSDYERLTLYENDARGNPLVTLCYDGTGLLLGEYHRAYDERNLCIRLEYYSSNGASVEEYGYDSEANLTWMTSLNENGEPISASRYEYDERNRLIRWYFTDHLNGHMYSEEYVYDETGRLIQTRYYDGDGNLQGVEDH